MLDEIYNSDLRLDQIPSIESDFTTIASFALTFDGYSRIKDIGSFANKTVGEFRNDQSVLLKLNLTELRACLFFEQRRYHHFGEDPEDADREYLNSLLSEITKRVENQQTN